MGAHVLGLGGWGVVHITADVEVPVVGRVADLGDRDAAGVAGHVLVTFEDGDDLLDVLRAEVILGAAGMELGVGVDEKDLATPVGGFGRVLRSAGQIGSQHQDAGGDRGAIEEVGR